MEVITSTEEPEEAMEGGDDSECETDARRWVLLSWTEVLHYG